MPASRARLSAIAGGSLEKSGGGAFFGRIAGEPGVGGVGGDDPTFESLPAQGVQARQEIVLGLSRIGRCDAHA